VKETNPIALRLNYFFWTLNSTPKIFTIRYFMQLQIKQFLYAHIYSFFLYILSYRVFFYRKHIYIYLMIYPAIKYFNIFKSVKHKKKELKRKKRFLKRFLFKKFLISLFYSPKRHTKKYRFIEQSSGKLDIVMYMKIKKNSVLQVKNNYFLRSLFLIRERMKIHRCLKYYQVAVAIYKYFKLERRNLYELRKKRLKSYQYKLLRKRIRKTGIEKTYNDYFTRTAAIMAYRFTLESLVYKLYKISNRLVLKSAVFLYKRFALLHANYQITTLPRLFYLRKQPYFIDCINLININFFYKKHKLISLLYFVSSELTIIRRHSRFLNVLRRLMGYFIGTSHRFSRRKLHCKSFKMLLNGPINKHGRTKIYMVEFVGLRLQHFTANVVFNIKFCNTKFGVLGIRIWAE
jgi:hypothetical protein